MSGARDLQLSAFPDHAPSKPVGQVLPSVFTGSNANLMARVAPVYLEGLVMDVTYGEGNWWTRYRPEGLICHDLYKLDGVDFRALPEADNSVDVVTFDPPYVPAGTSRLTGATADEADFRDRYGLLPVNRAGLLDMVNRGMAEATRVASRFVVTKCQDYTDGGRFHLGHIDMLDAARAAGWHPFDLIIHHSGTGMGGHNIFNVKRSRRNHSYLFVFTPKVAYS